MTTYGAYDAGLPCKNPNCKSHGKPHPNCRCYGEGLAKGGEVKSFCSEGKAHRRECKYFKDGGEVNPLDIQQHADPSEAVSHYLAHEGLHGLLKMKSENPLKDLDRYNSAVKRGGKSFDVRIKSLFEGGKSETEDHSKHQKFIDDWISRGGITEDISEELHKQNAAPQAFADGGDVKESKGIEHHDLIASSYPEHNMLLHTARGRTSGYLNGLKPRGDRPKLAFDDHPDDRKQKKSYDRALHIAAHPLGVLDKIHKGTIEPEHLEHLKGLYPELHDTLQKKLTKRIIEAQLNGEKPSQKVRQGLSLLLGTPLSGELSPQNIMAAQAVFQNKKDAQQAGAQPQKKTSALANTDQSYLLPTQAAAERQQKQ
jgi:hypothetical protein